jgi:hypothetical protein
MEGQPKTKIIRLRIGMWWRLVLMGVMLYAVALCFAGVVRAAGAAWRGSYLSIVAVLIPFEAYISLAAAERRQLRGSDRTRFRLTEAIVLLLATQLLRRLLNGLPSGPVHLGSLLDPEAVASSALVLLFWSAASALIAWFGQLEYQPGEVAPPVTSREYDLWVGSRVRHVQHTAAFQRILALYLAGGVFVLLLSGLAQVPPTMLIDVRRGTARAVMWPALAYFLAGLALAAEGRLTLLYTRWQQEKVEVSPAISKRWPLMVAGLLLICLVIALLLPIDYSLSLLDAAAVVINAVVAALVTLAYVLMYLLGMLLYPLQWLISSMRGQAGAAPPQLRLQPQAAPSQGSGFPFLEVMKTILLWAVACFIAAYALYNFLRQHLGAYERFASFGFLKLVSRLVASLLAALRRRGALVSRALAQRLAQRRRAAAVTGRRVERRLLAQLSPRELLHYYYLSLLERAARAGLARRPHQTPFEYEQNLASQLPEAAPDIALLTQAFVEARYSPHPVEPSLVQAVRAHWLRAKKALREWRAARAPRKAR